MRSDTTKTGERGVDLILVPTFNERRRRGRGFYRTDTEAVMQRVILAPDPMIILKHGDGWQQFKQFYRNRAQNRTEFVHTFKFDIKSAIRVVESFPLMAMDYQIIIDHRGSIFQFDIDRVFLGSLYENPDFEQIFIKTYNEVMSLLMKLERFSQLGYGSSKTDKGDLGGESVMMKYNRSRHLKFSRSALEIVRSMKGRLGHTPEVDMSSTPRIMMTDLVQTITRVPCSNCTYC